MSGIRQHRCHNHDLREAVARCPDCSRFFCRECVTEHGARMLCATCMRRALRGGEISRRRKGSGRPTLIALALGGFIFAWLCFYLIGRLLLRIPSEFHEGTIWETVVAEE